MHLTNTQRVIKLINNLVKNPSYITKYVKHNFFFKGLPMDLDMPWWSYKAIEYVDTIVKAKKIFEYGTGGSTTRFAKKAKSITCVEDNLDWLNLVKDRLIEKSLNNVTIYHEYFDFKNSIDFLNSSFLKKIDEDNFDIVIIDGQDESFKERVICFRYVEPKMKSGQFIIVDDFWRYEELLISNRAKEVKVFESVGPCRYGVTSTAVFCY